VWHTGLHSGAEVEACGTGQNLQNYAEFSWVDGALRLNGE
jgi:hypothetical protein